MIMSSEIITSNAPQFSLPYSQALRAGDFVYVSGQVGVDPVTREVAGDTIEAQTTQCVRNIEAILQAAGLTLDHVVKVNAYLASGDLTPGYNATYEKLFNTPYPARTTVTSGIGTYLIEIDAVAYAPSCRGE